jgi:adenine phosphoribosyltransferase
LHTSKILKFDLKNYLCVLNSLNIMRSIDELIRTIPDFPKAGIQFKDITPLLQDAAFCSQWVQEQAAILRPLQIEAVAGIESRGFIFGMVLAQALQCPFIPIRKKGKLPAAVYQVEYELEYGTDVLEMHQDALKPNQRVLIHDDVLATGGTAMAAQELIRQASASTVAVHVIIELGFLQAAQRFPEVPVFSGITY